MWALLSFSCMWTLTLIYLRDGDCSAWMEQTGLKPAQKALQELIVWQHHCFMSCCSISVNTLREVLPHPYRAQIHNNARILFPYDIRKRWKNRREFNRNNLLLIRWEQNHTTTKWRDDFEKAKSLKHTGSQLCFSYRKMRPHIIYRLFFKLFISGFWQTFSTPWCCTLMLFCKERKMVVPINIHIICVNL